MSDPSLSELRRELEEKLKKASPLPWVQRHSEIECDGCGDVACCCEIEAECEIDTEYLSCLIQSCGLESFAIPNADLIVAAVNALPTLLAALEELQHQTMRQGQTIQSRSEALFAAQSERDEAVAALNKIDQIEKDRLAHGCGYDSEVHEVVTAYLKRRSQ